MGGLIRRVKNCMDRLQELYDGKIDRIEELEEKQLAFCGEGENYNPQHMAYNSWSGTVTANVI